MKVTWSRSIWPLLTGDALLHTNVFHLGSSGLCSVPGRGTGSETQAMVWPNERAILGRRPVRLGTDQVRQGTGVLLLTRGIEPIVAVQERGEKNGLVVASYGPMGKGRLA